MMNKDKEKNPSIAVRIGVTKNRQAGFTFSFTEGLMPAEEGRVETRFRSAMILDNPALLIKHASNYVLYDLIDRKVHPCDADGDGRLDIAVAIPSDYQLAENQSPYTLLKELYDTFLRSNTRPDERGDRRSILDKDCDPLVFKQIISKYQLEPRKNPYRVMNPAGKKGICRVATEDNLRELFRDSQYPEFRNFQEIEVGSTCTPSPELENIRIPRPIEYRLRVNGKLRDAIYSDMNQKIPISDKEYYETSATLQELIEKASHGLYQDQTGAQFAVDTEKCIIDCTLKQKPVYYKVDVDYNFKSAKNVNPAKFVELIKTRLRRKEVEITLSSNSTDGKALLYDYQNDCFESILQKEAKIKTSVTLSESKIKYDGQHYELEITREINDYQKTLFLTIYVKKESSGFTNVVKPEGTFSETLLVPSVICKDESKLQVEYNKAYNDGRELGLKEGVNKGREDARFRWIKRVVLFSLLAFTLGAVLSGYLVFHFVKEASAEDQTNKELEECEEGYESLEKGYTELSEEIKKFIKDIKEEISNPTQSDKKDDVKDENEEYKELIENNNSLDQKKKEYTDLLKKMIVRESQEAQRDSLLDKFKKLKVDSKALQDCQKKINELNDSITSWRAKSSAAASGNQKATEFEPKSPSLREQVLQLAYQKDFKACESHRGWTTRGVLSKLEKMQIESALKLAKYNVGTQHELSKGKKVTVQSKQYQAIKKAHDSAQLTSMDDIVALCHEYTRILNNKNK